MPNTTTLSNLLDDALDDTGSAHIFICKTDNDGVNPEDTLGLVAGYVGNPMQVYLLRSRIEQATDDASRLTDITVRDLETISNALLGEPEVPALEAPAPDAPPPAQTETEEVLRETGLAFLDRLVDFMDEQGWDDSADEARAQVAELRTALLSAEPLLRPVDEGEVAEAAEANAEEETCDCTYCALVSLGIIEEGDRVAFNIVGDVQVGGDLGRIYTREELQARLDAISDEDLSEQYAEDADDGDEDDDDFEYYYSDDDDWDNEEQVYTSPAAYGGRVIGQDAVTLQIIEEQIRRDYGATPEAVKRFSSAVEALGFVVKLDAGGGSGSVHYAV